MCENKQYTNVRIGDRGKQKFSILKLDIERNYHRFSAAEIEAITFQAYVVL